MAGLLALPVLFTACKKDYFDNSGLQKGIFNESGLQVLIDRPMYFDSLVTVIQLAGMEDIIKDSSITFFAPTNASIRLTMNVLNTARYVDFKDSLKLTDVPGIVWRKYLSRYIFRGRYMLKDISRWDPSQLGVYPGMNLQSFDGYIMNIGVQFSDYNDTKDVGPRSLFISSIGDLANPDGSNALVASSDFQTDNAIIHVLNAYHQFGFISEDFIRTVQGYIQ